MGQRKALVVRGGWEGHDPVGCTEAFIPRLERAGFGVTVAESLAVYEDAALLAATDLVVHSWSGGELTTLQESTLVSAVEAGTGFAGWHGGVIGTNVTNARYLRMVGGGFSGTRTDSRTSPSASPPHRTGTARSPRASKTSTSSPSTTGY